MKFTETNNTEINMKKTLGKTRLHIQSETNNNCEESLATVKKGLQDKCLVN